MGFTKHLLAGVFGALLFLALYLLVVWFQFRLIGSSTFMRSLGPYSPLVVHIGHVGLDLVPVIIDAVVLAMLTLTSLGSLSELVRALELTVVVSVIIASTTSLAYLLIIHGLSGLSIYEFSSLTIFTALMTDVIAVMAICMLIKAKECLRPRALALITYANALIIDYLIDSLNSTVIAAMKGLEPVIGALGPVDGLVIDPLLIMAMAYLTLRLTRNKS
ncbi:hypothetical protein [Vulcanisaeta souniana]|nr:hypothetical protein [Vulcanisaeta souniana]BDR91806.1 hypothetical protein Vsou_08990 [Vulcanisaeta souniana JCM 11219]